MSLFNKLAPFALLALGLALLAEDAEAQRGRSGARSAPSRSSPVRSGGFQRSAPSRPSGGFSRPSSGASRPSYSRPSSGASRPSYSRPSSGSSPSYTRPSTGSSRPSTGTYTAPPSTRSGIGSSSRGFTQPTRTYTRPSVTSYGRTATPPTTSSPTVGSATLAGPSAERGAFGRGSSTGASGALDRGVSSVPRYRFPRPATPRSVPDARGSSSGRGTTSDRLRAPSARGPSSVRSSGRSTVVRAPSSNALDRYRSPGGRSPGVDRADAGPGAGRSGSLGAREVGRSGRPLTDRSGSPGLSDRSSTGRSSDGPSSAGAPGSARVGGSATRSIPKSGAVDRTRTGTREPRQGRGTRDPGAGREILVAGEVVAGATLDALNIGLSAATGRGGEWNFFDPHRPYYGGGGGYGYGYGYGGSCWGFGFTAGYWYGNYYGCYPWYGWYSPWYVCNYWWSYPWAYYRPYAYYPAYYGASPYYASVVNYYYETQPAEPAVQQVEVVEVVEGEGVAANVAQEPDDPRGRSASWYLQQGDQAFREGRYGDAADYYTKAAAFAPDDGLMFLVLSDALLATGDYHYGAYALRRALKLDDSLFETPVDKHDFYADPSEFDRHVAILENYLADRPGDDDARLLLAANYLNGLRPAAAVDLLEEPIAQNLMRQAPAQQIHAAASAAQHGD